jgi:AraC family transcriptional regulator
MLRSLDGATPVANSKPLRTSEYSVEVQRSGPATLPAIHHNLHLVTVVLTGEPVVLPGDPREGSSVRLLAGDSTVRPSGPGRRVCWPQGIHCLHVHLHPRLVRRLSRSAASGLQMLPRLRDPIIRDIGLQLYSLVGSGAPLDPRAAPGLVMALAHHVASAYPGPDTPVVQVGARTLEQVLDAFRERPPASYPVSTLAAWCGLSRPHFSRRIRALTGLWPQTLILGSRIEAAKHLLERGEASVSEVAYAVGFADQSHLTRVLRRSTGFTPRSYAHHGRSRHPYGSSVG